MVNNNTLPPPPPPPPPPPRPPPQYCERAVTTGPNRWWMSHCDATKRCHWKVGQHPPPPSLNIDVVDQKIPPLPPVCNTSGATPFSHRPHEQRYRQNKYLLFFFFNPDINIQTARESVKAAHWRSALCRGWTGADITKLHLDSGLF